MDVTTIGLDLAKNIFQVHGVDAEGQVAVVRRLRRSQMLEFFSGLKPCLVGMEACPTAHYWGRELRSLGHDVRLIPPQYVKPYVRRSKNDAADAAAICEAVARPSMRFVPIKDEMQQAALMLHRVRDLLVRQRVQAISAIRAHAAEFGVIEAKGPRKLASLFAAIEADEMPDIARDLIAVLREQLDDLDNRIADVDRRISSWHKSNETSRRLSSIPGVGTLTATAIAATVPDASVFRGGREFAAWLGLVPRQNSSGGRERLGKISKQGNEHVRRLLIIGAQAALLCSKEIKANPWVQSMMARRPRMVVVVALANKMARIAWALMVRRTQYGVAAAA